jgi:hypothetical protein
LVAAPIPRHSTPPRLSFTTATKTTTPLSTQTAPPPALSQSAELLSQDESLCPICHIDLSNQQPIDREQHIDQCLRKVAGSPVRVDLQPDAFELEEIDMANAEDVNIRLIGTRYTLIGSGKRLSLSAEQQKEECLICLESFRDSDDQVALMNCFCRFHQRCIDGWFRRRQQCPVHRDN